MPRDVEDIAGLPRIFELAALGADTLPMRERAKAWGAIVGYAGEKGHPDLVVLARSLRTAAEAPTDAALLSLAPPACAAAREWLRAFVGTSREAIRERQMNN